MFPHDNKGGKPTAAPGTGAATSRLLSDRALRERIVEFDIAVRSASKLVTAQGFERFLGLAWNKAAPRHVERRRLGAFSR
jgi:hypothetical protein